MSINAIGYGVNEQDLRAKGCNEFVKTGDILSLANKLTRDTIIVAENVDDEILKSLQESYDLKVIDATKCSGALSPEQEDEIELLKYAGDDYITIAKKLEKHVWWIVNSRAFSGRSHIEKCAYGFLS